MNQSDSDKLQPRHRSRPKYGITVRNIPLSEPLESLRDVFRTYVDGKSVFLLRTESGVSCGVGYLRLRSKQTMEMLTFLKDFKMGSNVLTLASSETDPIFINTVLVKGLSSDITEKDVYDAFDKKKFPGEIVEIRMTGKESAYVMFEKWVTYSRALEVGCIEINRRERMIQKVSESGNEESFWNYNLDKALQEGLIKENQSEPRPEGELIEGNLQDPQQEGLVKDTEPEPKSELKSKEGGLSGDLSTGKAEGLFGDSNRDSNLSGSHRPEPGPQQGGLIEGNQSDPQQEGLIKDNQPDPKPQQGGLFGGNQPESSQTGGLFGSSKPSGGLFGDSSKGQGGGLFGGSQPEPKSQQGGLFRGEEGILFGENKNVDEKTGLFKTVSEETKSEPQKRGLFGGISGGLFGGNQLETERKKGGLFECNQLESPPQTGGLFGNSNPSGELFGGQGGGLFGGNQPESQQPGGLFGNSKPSGGLLGGQGGGLFGSNQPELKPQQGGLFGGNQPESPQTGGLFGNSKPSGGLFGDSSKGQGGGLFEGTNSGLFGSNQSQGGLFAGNKSPGKANIFGEKIKDNKITPSRAFGDTKPEDKGTKEGETPEDKKRILEDVFKDLFGKEAKGAGAEKRKTNTMFQNLFRSKKFADLVFEVQGEEILAHRAVLATKSKFFEDLLLFNSQETTGKIVISDVEPAIFKALLEYLYCGEIQADEEIIMKLMNQISTRYNIPELASKCQQKLVSMMTPNNFIRIIKIAEELECSEFWEGIVSYFDFNGLGLVKAEQLDQLPRAILASVVDKFNSSIKNQINKTRKEIFI